MLGLYCDVYKRRLSPRLKLFYDAIEHEKSVVFPEQISVQFVNGKHEVRPFFSNLIAMVEKQIDYENMIEAARGSIMDSGAIELDVEEAEMEKDSDLAPVLLNQYELKFGEEGEEEVVLGKGSFGKVVKAQYRSHDVAVKMLKHDGSSGLESEEELAESLARFRQECIFMKELKHTNIVMMIGAVWSLDLCCCVLEFCAGGTLQDVVRRGGVRRGGRKSLVGAWT